MAFLDETGLAEFWEQSKGLINAHVWRKQGAELARKDATIFETNVWGWDLYYSDSVKITSDASIALANPTYIAKGEYDGDIAGLNTLLTGKYVQYGSNPATTNDPVYYCHGVTAVNTEDCNATVSEVYLKYTANAFVCNPNRYAFPPDEYDGFAYTYLGQWGLASLYVANSAEATALLNTLLGVTE